MAGAGALDSSTYRPIRRTRDMTKTLQSYLPKMFEGAILKSVKAW